ncbi:MAG: alkaline phosphatase D family protein [Pseudomonadota bacterium]|nr:alkaline phosphatase D family protein [Pseudomonadota bacterium]
MPLKLTRRSFVLSSTASGLVAASGLAMPAISRAQSRPIVTHGLQSGDVDANSGMIWARADRPSRMIVEVATSDTFRDSVRLSPTDALPENDFAAKRLLDSLPSDQDIFYRVSFADLDDVNGISEPVVGHFRTAPASRRSVKLVWSGDTAGQGWGIDESRGGMSTYATMLRHEPDFFLHSGDTVYSDGPIAAEKEMPNGEIWRSIVAEGVEKVAETLDEFRGRFKYNMLDEHVRALNAAVPTIYQWDDHEVLNNWSASKDLGADDRYTVKSVPLLAARAGRAFHEMTPIRYTPAEPGRVYRKIGYGPLLDVFVIDLRSYRGPNDANVEPTLAPEDRILGTAQIRWLQQALLESRATWKVIASDMPIGLIVWNDSQGKAGSEAIANAENGPALGRELELADLLRFIKSAQIQNVVWLTADVHYTAAHYYDPSKAAFQDFEPFWEFVSGPLHAGTFGPGELDMTFGPEAKYVKAPAEGQEQNKPPSEGLQFFGVVEIDGQTEAMTVRLMDRADTELFRQTLEPKRVG